MRLVPIVALSARLSYIRGLRLGAAGLGSNPGGETSRPAVGRFSKEVVANCEVPAAGCLQRRPPPRRFLLRRARSASRSKPGRAAVRGSGTSAGVVDESATGSANFWSGSELAREPRSPPQDVSGGAGLARRSHSAAPACQASKEGARGGTMGSPTLVRAAQTRRKLLLARAANSRGGSAHRESSSPVSEKISTSYQPR